MKLINHIFKSESVLKQFISNNIDHNKNILIQLFCGTSDISLINSVLKTLSKELPSAEIIGASTAGEIVNGKIYRDGINISFSIFEHTTIETKYYLNSNFNNGVKAAQDIIKQDTKVVIALSEGLKSDSESFINGFSSVNDDLLIAGGNAGDNNLFKETFIIKGSEVYFDGIVIASLRSTHLNVNSNYTLAWTQIGKDMVVTKADKNIIYEIDNKPIQDLYVHYLGKETVENIPASAIEFPLIKIQNGVKVARSIVAKQEDGFVYAGHFNKGDIVRFAIGNIEQVLNDAPQLQTSIRKNPVEATYIYSCSVRDLFINEQLNYEFGLIEEVAPTSGFFTYGEFYHSDKSNQLLNITTTTISLSEKDNLSSFKSDLILDQKTNMLKSLTHLVNQTQDELDESLNSLNQYKKILDESTIVSKTDTDGVITYVNNQLCNVSGYTREELVGSKHNILRHTETSSSLYESMWRNISQKKIWKGTFKNLNKNGETYYVKGVIMPLLDDQGNIEEYISASINVTDIIEKEKIIKEQFLDELTSLNNKEALFHRLKTSHITHYMALINIDRFSDINNYFGYDMGDQILIQFSKKLDNVFPNHELYRVSGDEFAVIFSNDYNSLEELHEYIQKQLNTLESHKYKVDDIEITLSISCGGAYANSKNLYKLSHMALKESAETNNKFIFFDENNLADNAIKKNYEMINSIKSAINDNRIIPYFQGIVDNKTNKITKYESLIRMIDSNGKVITPFFFLEHAKKAKLYDNLTHIMIEKSFEKFHNTEFEFSLNLTIKDIESKETRKALKDALKKYKCGNRVILEIVESEGVDNFDEVNEFIQEIKTFGCKIAIDDFGSGYSNFAYLTKLKVDFIKIDGSLIKDIDKDFDKKAIVHSIVFFAQSLGIKTIAEFVEDENILNTINIMGINYSQGYLFSKPSEKLQ